MNKPDFYRNLFLMAHVTYFCKKYLTTLTGKDWCFTQFSTGMAGWLLLIFLICLHNQLSSIHSIIGTDV